MKIVFIGGVKIGLTVLGTLYKSGYAVDTVITLPFESASTTSGFVDFGPLTKANMSDLIRVKDVNQKKYINSLEQINPDLIIVCGWQRLICKEILQIPRLGTIGFHSSLLPKYRGRAPVNWAIIKGERMTGVTMFYCDTEADNGDIIAQKSFPIKLYDTCADVYDKSAKAACQLIRKFLPQIGKITVRTKKNMSSRYRFWPKRNPQDGLINWNRNALGIHNWIRALTRPYPGAYTYFNHKKYFIWQSRLSAKSDLGNRRPGEILEMTQRNGKLNLLVAGRDRPIWVFDITDEHGKRAVKNDFANEEPQGI